MPRPISGHLRDVPPWLRTPGRAAALGVTYALLSWGIQRITAFGDDASSTVFWPAAGVTVSVLLRRPKSEWPALLAAVWIAETVLDVDSGFGPVVSGCWGLANVAEPLVAATVLSRHADRRVDLASRAGFLRFALWAVVVGPAVGALIGATTSVAFADDQLWPRLPRWFVGDAIGVLTIAPAFLVAASPRRVITTRRALGPAVALAATVAVALGPWDPGTEMGLPYLVVPALVAVGLQLSARQAAAAMLVVAAVVEGVTAAGAGPFATHGGTSRLVEAQMFLAMSAFSLWSIAALMSDLIERERAAAELLATTRRDELTGISNRRHAVHRLDDLMAALERNGGAVTALFLDLDGFKGVNDRYGHAAGDQVLKVLADRLQSSLRGVDLIARLGGDEFLILTDACGSPADVDALASRVDELVRAPIDWRGHQVVVGASIGSTTTTVAVRDVERFLDEADRDMYRVKLDRTAAERVRTTPAEPSTTSER